MRWRPSPTQVQRQGALGVLAAEMLPIPTALITWPAGACEARGDRGTGFSASARQWSPARVRVQSVVLSACLLSIV